MNKEEKRRLIQALQTALSISYIDDIEDFIWEAIFAYAKNIPIPDPMFNTRSKRLFDIVDHKHSIGWSAKALQLNTDNLHYGRQFELVIQRADIFKKSKILGFDFLDRNSPTDDLGRAILRHWYQKVNEDARIQGVQDKRICILLKTRDKTQYALLEQEIPIYSEDDLYWQWTDESRTGLQGFLKKSDTLVFRWYPNQTHLFECFVLPEDAYMFDLTPQRLPIEELISILEPRLRRRYLDRQ